MAKEFAIHEIDSICTQIYTSTRGTAAGDDIREWVLSHPGWNPGGVAPLSSAYRDHQMSIWKCLTGRDQNYCPKQHEVHEYSISTEMAIKRPGFYRLDNTTNAGDHLIAIGHILKRAGLNKGDCALEYGAGFGQIALAFARLGVETYTVDINPAHCKSVADQAEFFDVPLKPFVGEFGFNPVSGKQYDLIYFYESFHHCLDFPRLVQELTSLLKPSGRIFLVGEPIVSTKTPAIPYPWGIRLQAEAVAVARKHGWLELGFYEDFLIDLFGQHKLLVKKLACPISHYGTIYAFRFATGVVPLSELFFSNKNNATWHQPQGTGRWTKALSELDLPSSRQGDTIGIKLKNLLPVSNSVKISWGGDSCQATLNSREERIVEIRNLSGERQLIFEGPVISPAKFGMPDKRELGLFVESISF